MKKIADSLVKVKKMVLCEEKNLIGLEVRGKSKLKEEVESIKFGETKSNQQDFFHFKEG
jgi:hypothetical protein